ncbi:hypothetical protein SVIOM74S_03484 [Streptomyces violarus]
MCRGGQGDTNRPLVADAQVFVALCSQVYYDDRGCGADWAVFEHRLHLVPPQFRPSDPPARVLAGAWQPAKPPSGVPLAPVLSGEITDSYASKGIYGIICQEGLRSQAYWDAVDEIAAAVCAGQECSPPEVSVGELPARQCRFPEVRAMRGFAAPRPLRSPGCHGLASRRMTRRDRWVFISYAHEEDGDVHKGKVAALAERLREEGIDASWDTSAHRKGPQHWARWMHKHYKEADFVLVMVSPAYKRRAEHEEEPGKGDGVAYEADLILSERMAVRRWYERILLGSFPEHGKAYVPFFLDGVTLYTLYQDLPELIDFIKSKLS